MKDIIINDEVKSKIQRLHAELHTICVENGVPMVVCSVLGRTKQDDGTLTEKMLSCYMNKENDVFDQRMLLAAKILEMNEIPVPLIALVLGSCLDQGNKQQPQS